MKIGILLTCYNCESYVDECLSPWISLRDNGEFNFIFAANSGMFKDYLELNIPEKNKGTLSKLITKELDFLVTTSGKNLLDEDSSRNVCLDYLKRQSCDLIVVLDGDEIYKENQIRGILKFVLENPSYDGYGINFKNYTIKKDLFTYEYCHDRIFWMDRHEGIQRFYFDNQFIYNSPSPDYSNRIQIPKSIAYIDHHSWVETDPRTKDKILYQNKRYIGSSGDFPLEARCSFVWNEVNNSLEFNPEFWNFHKIQIPILRKEGEIYTFDLKIDFHRLENRIDIINFNREGNHYLLIKDLDGTNYGTFNLYLSKGISYWINPTGEFNLDQSLNCEGISVEVFYEDEKIHHEYLYLKIK